MSKPRFQFFKRINVLFSLTVIAPTLIAALYYGLIASDVYISQASFLIYNPQSPQISGLDALLRTTGLSGSSPGALAVQDYIGSRAALAQLQQDLALSRLYGSSKIDPFNRFGGWIWPNTSREELFKYYKGMVTDDINTSSNISSLRVAAYTPQDALNINRKLLALGQNLINQLNKRANADAVRFYLTQVSSAESRVTDAELALMRYRNQSGLFTPGPQASLQSQLISKLEDEFLRAQLQLRQAKANTPRNPQISVLERVVADLRAQIRQQTTKLAGDPHSIASKSAEYERLALNKTFAQRELADALASLQQAQVEAQKQQMFLELISAPSLPDLALEPKRARNTAAVFLLGFIVWGILSILIAGVREHHD